MPTKSFIAVLVALLALSEAADADQTAAPEQPPGFTAAEHRIIARNQVLGTLADANPWLARRALDALAALDAPPETLERSMGTIGDAPADARAPTDDGSPLFDAHKNPDLGRLERAAPEALYDLFLLLKQASASKPQVAK